MTWARRLKRVFLVDIEVCEQCGGCSQIHACIEDPDVITRILDHLNSTRRQQSAHEPRAPPTRLFPSNLTTRDTEAFHDHGGGALVLSPTDSAISRQEALFPIVPHRAISNEFSGSPMKMNPILLRRLNCLRKRYSGYIVYSSYTLTYLPQGF